jgi:hypothetical protein
MVKCDFNVKEFYRIPFDARRVPGNFPADCHLLSSPAIRIIMVILLT